MADVIRDHIEIVEGAGGPKPRIAGHRVRVRDVAIWYEKLGMSPDEIEGAIEKEHALAEELRRRSRGPLLEKLGNRRSE